jgi:hypothetical protein
MSRRRKTDRSSTRGATIGISVLLAALELSSWITLGSATTFEPTVNPGRSITTSDKRFFRRVLIITIVRYEGREIIKVTIGLIFTGLICTGLIVRN